MRLIGIYIDQQNNDPFVSKSLKGQWYPFYNGIHNPIDKQKIMACLNDSIDGLYQVKSKSNAKVSISCIVGKNGAGKSSLLDIMYGIINNFAYSYLQQMVKKSGVKLYAAKGIYASLFYEIEGKIFELRCKDEHVDLYADNQLCNCDGVEIRKALHYSFFYTIALNYSLYSFNKRDYENSLNKSINGKWIDGLFHKNDAYLTPMSLNPFRTNGNIDINKENGLALQRLSALALYFDSKGKNFIPGYKARKLRYQLRQNYERSLIEKIEKLDEPSKMKYYYDEFKSAYESSIPGKSYLGDELYNDVVSYMAYKTLKIGHIYADFKRELSPDRIDMYLEKVKEDQSHITYKLRQCEEFTKNSIYARGSDVHEIKIVDIHNSNIISSYRDAFELLPPSFYDIDVLFEKVKEENHSDKRQADHFSFTSMSSGERQLLYSLSSVLYHIQNLESVEDDACRISYQHVNIVLDEVELYSHPEYQRTFIADLLDRLSWLKISFPIKSINILLVTHSPFILSDIPKNNILYLKDGEAVCDTSSFVNTLGANVNDILHQSFFLENGFMGENIQRKIQSLINFLKSDHEKTYEWSIKKATDFISILGDEIVVAQLRLLLSRKQMKDKGSYRAWLEQELEKIKGDEA